MKNINNMIRRIILSTLLVPMIFLLGFEQARAQNSLKVPEFKPFRENWHTLSPKVDEFIVEVPLDLSTTGGSNENSSRKYYGLINGTYLYVFSDPIKTPNNRRIIAQFVNLSGKATMSENGPVGDGRISFSDSIGFHHNIIEVRTETRIFIAQTVSRNENDAIAERFLSSFKLASDTSNIRAKETSSKEDTSNKVDATPAESSQEQLIDPRLAYGSAMSGKNDGGISSTDTNTAPPKPATGESKALRILSKAKPTYTDFARFYEIGGTVILQVTFMSSGEIGSISVIKGLPFSLTEMAISAARQIRFEPAIRDGVPVSVTKRVVYEFSIY
jgi:TonB family protein